MTTKNNYKPVPAKVKVNNVLKDLDITNANSFIVYKSLVGGHIMFECIVASKFGLSMHNSFYDLYVYRHKSKTGTSTISKDEIISMRGGDDEEEDEDDVEVETAADDADDVDDKEPDDSDDEPELLNPQSTTNNTPESHASNPVVEPDNVSDEPDTVTEEPIVPKKIIGAKRGKKVTKA